LTISLQFLIEDLLTVVRAVKLEVRPLFLPHLVKLTDIIADGLHKLTWVSADWKNFVDRANDAIKRFKVLVKFCVWKEQK
jgi:dynein heavy chain